MNLSLKIQAALDLMKRYAAVFKSSWSLRHAMKNPKRLSHELVFLPANLELAETPVHPAPHWAMRIVALGTILVLAIGVLSYLDIVVVAKGKLVPDARVKIIQPAITGVVRQIAVEDGQCVSAGDLLVQLDQTQADADAVNAHEERVASALDGACAQALLAAIATDMKPTIAKVEGASPSRQNEVQRRAEGLYQEYEDKWIEGQAELVQHNADLASANQTIEGLRKIAPISREIATDYKAQVANKAVSPVEYMDKEQTAVTEEQELAEKMSYADGLKAAIGAQEAQIASITSQFRREQLDALNQATQKYEEACNAEIKAVTRQRLMSLYAPVSGTVQQLAIHTVGGVVTTAQTLMEIVPDDALDVEANIENKDVGFVKKGQEVVIKVEAFPYTQYGYLHGVVQFISNDSVQDKKNDLTFTAHIKPTSTRILANDQWVNLTPGMTVSAEIKTGKRSVMAYFLDPLIQTAHESMRER
jgi:hemolysin D